MLNRLALLLLLAPLGSACVTTRAQTPVDRPALEVPPVPPRVIEPMPQRESSQPEPVADLPPERATAPKPKAQPPRDPAKPETKPETTPPPVEPPAQVVTPPTQPAVPPLRTGTTDTAEATRQVRQVLDRARGLLERTDFQKLPDALKSLYRNAQLLMKESEDALKAANVDLARKLADKADTIAKELQGR
jgi:hypothetical protein